MFIEKFDGGQDISSVASGEIEKREISTRPHTGEALKKGFDETAYSFTSVHPCGRIVTGNFQVWKQLFHTLKDSNKLRSYRSG